VKAATRQLPSLQVPPATSVSLRAALISYHVLSTLRIFQLEKQGNVEIQRAAASLKLDRRIPETTSAEGFERFVDRSSSYLFPSFSFEQYRNSMPTFD
jgi:hypothetical protein